MFALFWIVILVGSIATASYAQTYIVERVIDGDTLKLTNGEEVQLIGIQAPEDEKMEQVAKQSLEQLLILKGLGIPLRLEFDVQERDKEGRLLAYVYIRYTGGTKSFLGEWDYKFYDSRIVKYHFEDGSSEPKVGKKYLWKDFFVNANLVKHGLAQPMTIPLNVKYAELFEELYQEAREHKRGLWKDVKGALKDGIYKEYFDTGEIWRETTYKDGKEDGSIRIYYRNGKLQAESTKRDGKTDGIVRMYYEDGTLQHDWHYKEDKPDGSWKWFREDGTLIMLNVYKDSILIAEEKYDREGNLISEETFEDEGE